MTLYYYGIYNNYGGLENFAKNMISNLLARKKDLKIVLLVEQEDISFKDLFVNLGVEIVVLPKWKRHPFKFYRSLLSLLRSRKSDDVLQLNVCTYRNFFLFKAAKKSGIKTIIVGHYTMVPAWKFGFLHYFNRFLFRTFGIQVSNSDDVRKFMFYKHSNPITILNGIDTKIFSYSIEKGVAFKEKNNLTNNIVIGQIGRISEDKNQLFSIKVVQKIHELRKDVVLVLIGKIIHQYIIDYIKSNHCDDYIKYIGTINSNIENCYNAFDISLLPSKNEGLSLCLLENSSNGLKMFASDSVPKLNLPETNTSYLKLDVDLWVNEIMKFINCGIPKNRKNYLIGTQYDLDYQVDRYYDLYKGSTDNER